MDSSSVLCWPAPAKINLFLHITDKRPDGYHQLQTLFQLLDWGDEVQIESLESGGISRINEISDFTEDEDLCIRAARLLKKESGCRKGANIRLTKHIPPGTGLGGGSSDAATALCALNFLWGCGLSVVELAQLGLELGADVPVFVHGHSAWAEGIGERLQTHTIDDSWYVLVFPEISISTKLVFSDPGLRRNSRPIRPLEYGYSSTSNDCEDVVMKLFPAMREIMLEIQQWGSPRMTGTGSCIFIPVNKKNDAIRITNELKSRYNVRAVRGVNESPLLAKLLTGG